MKDKGNIKKHGTTSHRDSSSVGLITYILGLHGRVAASINSHDSWPNTDGEIEIHDKIGTPTANFRVQVKALPENHNGSYDFPVSLFKYVAELNTPIMVLLPDTKSGRVYWKYFDEENVKTIRYTSKQQTKSLKITKKDSFTKSEKAYIREWEQIADARKTKISEMRSALDEINTKDIARSKELLEANRPSEALALLEKLKADKWDILTPNEKYRVLNNIGISQHYLGDKLIAAQNLSAAYEYEPENENAKVNLALAKMPVDKPKEALKIVNAVLRQNPINPSAAVIKVRAMHSIGKSFKYIERTLDTTVRNAPEVLHAMSYATRNTDPETSISLLREAIKKDSDNIHATADLGIALLQLTQNQWQGKIRGELSDEERESVEEGISLLETAWSNLVTKEDKKSSTKLVV